MSLEDYAEVSCRGELWTVGCTDELLDRCSEVSFEEVQRWGLDGGAEVSYGHLDAEVICGWEVQSWAADGRFRGELWTRVEEVSY